MKRNISGDVGRVHAYLSLLLGSSAAATRTLADYLDRLVVEPGPIPDLGAMLGDVHQLLMEEPPSTFPGDGLSERERALNWGLRGLTVEERAVVLLGSIASSERLDGAQILGLSKGSFDSRHASAMQRMRSEVAMVMCRQAIVAMDIRSIVSTLGVLSVKVVADCGDLPWMIAHHRPAVIIADTSGFPPDALAECLDVRPGGQRVPAVVISAALRGTTKFPNFLPKPFSPAAVRTAVLNAIGA